MVEIFSYAKFNLIVQLVIHITLKLHYGSEKNLQMIHFFGQLSSFWLQAVVMFKWRHLCFFHEFMKPQQGP